MRRRSSNSVRVFYPKFDKGEIVRVLSERVKELGEKLPLIRIVLFGSHAKGNYTVGSDVDILVVYRGEKRDDAYALVKKILDIPRLERRGIRADEGEPEQDDGWRGGAAFRERKGIGIQTWFEVATILHIFKVTPPLISIAEGYPSRLHIKNSQIIPS